MRKLKKFYRKGMILNSLLGILGILFLNLVFKDTCGNIKYIPVWLWGGFFCISSATLLGGVYCAMKFISIAPEPKPIQKDIF